MKNNKKCLLLAAIICLLLLSNCLLCACTDYRYTYYFSVEGGNGTISMLIDGKIYESDTSPISYKVEREGSAEVAFLASPSDGYIVSHWICDGKIIAGSKNKIYINGLNSSSHKSKVHITVQFRSISSIEEEARYCFYHFSVESGNGTILMLTNYKTYESDKSPIAQEVENEVYFWAIPSDGYRVKQWTCDDNVVAGNQPMYTLDQRDLLATTERTIEKYITVEFEPVVTNKEENSHEK